MVYVLLVFSLLFSSCTNYVTKAEDLKGEADSKVFSLSPDSLETYLKENNLGVIWNLKYNSGASEGDISTLGFEFVSDEFITPKNLYLWAQNTEDEWVLLDSLKPYSGDFTTSNSLTSEILDNEYATLRLSLNNQGFPQYVLGDLNLSKKVITHLENIQSEAAPQLTSQTNSLYKALDRNFQLAYTHLKLAQAGSHTVHLKHVHHFLSGIKQADPTWWSEAPFPSADSISLILQLESFEDLLGELKTSAQIDEDTRTAIQSNLVHLALFKNELIEFMDTIESLIELDADGAADDLAEQEIIWSTFLEGNNEWKGYDEWPILLVEFLRFDSRL